MTMTMMLNVDNLDKTNLTNLTNINNLTNQENNFVDINENKNENMNEDFNEDINKDIKRPFFILNPVAGRAPRNRELHSLESYFLVRLGNFDYIFTKDREEAIKTTRRLLKEGHKQIVSVGGDGTVNSVVNGFFENGKLVSKDAFLTIGLAGTGEDYFKSIKKFYGAGDWRELVSDYQIVNVDVGKISFQNKEFSDQYFVNMASVAMIAKVVKERENLPTWLPSQVQYLWPTVKTIATYRSKKINLELDLIDDVTGERAEQPLNADFNIKTMTISKGQFAGGGMQFAQNVTLDSGYFEVTLFLAMNPLKMCYNLGKLYRGTYSKVEGILKFKAKKVEIKSEDLIAVEFDGEVYGTTDLKMEILEKKLRIAVPKK
ncbi:MAG: hypothetical protein HQK49_13430 [Oligoflexia bacterium]|nr:hypothetical protein [Oligoflexia bacterium]